MKTNYQKARVRWRDSGWCGFEDMGERLKERIIFSIYFIFYIIINYNEESISIRMRMKTLTYIFQS